MNACMDSVRRAKPRELDEDAVEMAAPAAQEEDIVVGGQSGSVQAALSSMPVKFRLPLLLRHFEDLSYTEMAEAMNCSMGTVASRLNRGIRCWRGNWRGWNEVTTSTAPCYKSSRFDLEGD